MNRAIFIEYESAGKRLGPVKFWAATPVTAINQFHSYMQHERKRSPDDYRMVRVFHSYTGGDNEVHNSDFDLPGGPNPALKERVVAGVRPEEQETFGW